MLGHEKTQFYPLRALNQEEASVGGTIRVLQKVMMEALGIMEEFVNAELRLFVGDWLSIRNIRLAKQEQADDINAFHKLNWVQEASMPFHFQLNALYALIRTHLGTNSGNPSWLEHHRTILHRGKLDPKKPEYNKARELVYHSLYTCILDCACIVLEKDSCEYLKNWKPWWKDFDAVAIEIVKHFASTSTAHKAMKDGDKVLAHSILFICDALFFWEFSDAVRDADVGRMWVIYDFWVYTFRGAGCHNYGNKILEMKAQFKYEYSPQLAEIVENTWLVNCFGLPGHSIPTDLYLEHNNNYTKNMFAAHGANASIEFIQKKGLACIEILRKFSTEMSAWFGSTEYSHRHSDVPAESDIQALCVDLESSQVHVFHPEGCHVEPLPSKKPRQKKNQQLTGVRDTLQDGREMLFDQGMFQQWLTQSLVGEGVDGALRNEDDEDYSLMNTAFDNSGGMMEVDTLNMDDIELIGDQVADGDVEDVDVNE
ncbi:hypothetical protein Moror_8592 [Moniliophthora roreri MCA 2997]|uniref:DUF6589 domain-containing protein n=2 Tax=Moniliophthora roreri TaxID=221103 RepID=V2YDB8_MONRO|nr:hypothetical protein Moror_8592 [Moniliophthora roreri MCA 2997]